MSTFEYAMIFVLSWWMLLFMVLPFKVQAVESSDPLIYKAAPKHTFLKHKLLITTLLAVPATLIVAELVKAGWLQ